MANYQSFVGAERLDDQSAGMAADGNGAMLMRVQHVCSDLLVALLYFARRRRPALARDDDARLCPLGQRCCVGEGAAVMRRHQYLDRMWWPLVEDTLQSLPFQVAGQQNRVSGVANEKHQTASILIAIGTDGRRM